MSLLVLGLIWSVLLAVLGWTVVAVQGRKRHSLRGLTTPQRTIERRFYELVSNSSDLIAVLNENAELVYANPAGERVLGLAPDEYLGRSVLDLVHPDDRERAAQAFKADVSVPGVHPTAVYRFRSPSHEWRFLEVTGNNCLAEPSIAGVVINTRDVTEWISLERAFRTLSCTNHVLLNALDEKSLLEKTCAVIVEAGNYSVAWVGYIVHDEARSVRAVAAAGRTGYVDDIEVSWGTNDAGRGLFARAVWSGRPEVAEDVRKTNGLPESRAAAIRYGLRAACMLPLRVGDETIGAFAIYADEAGVFGVEEVALLGELADALGYGIGRIRDASRLEQVESDFRLLAETAPIGILDIAPIASVVYANPKFAEIVGEPIEALLGRGWADFIYPDDLPGLQALIDGPYIRRESAVATFRVRRRGGEIRNVRMQAAPKGASVEDGDVVTIEDVTEEVRTREELVRQAFYDGLTGLPNRALFLDRLNQEMAKSRRGRGIPSVLFLDLDQFKMINDSLGHEKGDEVLKEVGKRLRDVVRSGETVARLGGDEFAFIIRDVKKDDDVFAVANRVLDVLRVPMNLWGQSLVITGSIGIVTNEQRDAWSLLQFADAAMYKAKASGKNRFELFDEELYKNSMARLTMEGELRRALANDEFELYYQPVVNPNTEKPFGAESLIRWNHPTRGLVSPLEFIPVAEEAGLVTSLGYWIIEQALKQLSSWDCQIDGPNLEVLSVNLSAKQLDDPLLPAVISQLLERSSIDRTRVLFEVTESVAMSNATSTRTVLEAFKELGFALAIDDFGTGYSSLAYLQTLPVSEVKVDQSFVSRLGGDHGSAEVVRAIVDMGHALGLVVVAEGVETEQLREAVSAMSVDYAQGFFWSPPLPADEFAEWWHNALVRVGAGPQT